MCFLLCVGVFETCVIVIVNLCGYVCWPVAVFVLCGCFYFLSGCSFYYKCICCCCLIVFVVCSCFCYIFNMFVACGYVCNSVAFCCV